MNRYFGVSSAHAYTTVVFFGIILQIILLHFAASPSRPFIGAEGLEPERLELHKKRTILQGTHVRPFQLQLTSRGTENERLVCLIPDQTMEPRNCIRSIQDR